MGVGLGCKNLILDNPVPCGLLGHMDMIEDGPHSWDPLSVIEERTLLGASPAHYIVAHSFEYIPCNAIFTLEQMYDRPQGAVIPEGYTYLTCSDQLIFGAAVSISEWSPLCVFI